MEVLQEALIRAGEAVDGAVEGVAAWQLVVGTAAFTLAALTLRDLYRARQDVYESLRAWVFRAVRAIPAVRREITRTLDQSRKEIESDMFGGGDGGVASLRSLPSTGWSREEVLTAATKVLGMGSFDWREGRISGGAFSGKDDTVTQMLTEIYGMFALSNPLHADIFPGVRKMEAEVVRMTLDLLHGGPETCGCVTTGGSESILMGVKAARDWGRHNKGITRPEMVLCHTAHAAFDKSASMCGVKLRKVAMDPVTCKVDLKAMRQAITSNTVLLVASAPDFPHGIIDDVEGVAALGEAWGVPVHVDCCMGGFLMPFMAAAGYHLPPFDFRVPGVTSISADTHKYGQAPKGSSVIMYRTRDYRHHQFFVTPDWPGGIYATHTVPGSRAGGLVAVCWASLLHQGTEGYTRAAKGIISTARKLKKLLREVPGVELFGDPLTSIVAFRSPEVDMLKVGDVLTEKGWHLNFLQYPPGLHICLTTLQANDGFAESLAADLREAVARVRANPSPTKGIGKVYGTAAGIPDKNLVGEAGKVFLQCYYDTLNGPVQESAQPSQNS